MREIQARPSMSAAEAKNLTVCETVRASLVESLRSGDLTDIVPDDVNLDPRLWRDFARAVELVNGDAARPTRDLMDRAAELARHVLVDIEALRADFERRGLSVLPPSLVEDEIAILAWTAHEAAMLRVIVSTFTMCMFATLAGRSFPEPEEIRAAHGEVEDHTYVLDHFLAAPLYGALAQLALEYCARYPDDETRETPVGWYADMMSTGYSAWVTQA